MKPFKFNPLLKQTIWGGDKIIPFKHLVDKAENVGESWEISGVKDNESIVADGEYKGRKLNDVVAEYKCILPTRWRINKVSCAVKPRCGM